MLTFDLNGNFKALHIITAFQHEESNGFTEKLCGLEISSTQVSRLAKILGEELEENFGKRVSFYQFSKGHWKKLEQITQLSD